VLESHKSPPRTEHTSVQTLPGLAWQIWLGVPAGAEGRARRMSRAAQPMSGLLALQGWGQPAGAGRG